MYIAGQSNSLQQSFYKHFAIEQHSQNHYVANHQKMKETLVSSECFIL